MWRVKMEKKWSWFNWDLKICGKKFYGASFASLLCSKNDERNDEMERIFFIFIVDFTVEITLLYLLLNSIKNCRLMDKWFSDWMQMCESLFLFITQK